MTRLRAAQLREGNSTRVRLYRTWRSWSHNMLPQTGRTTPPTFPLSSPHHHLGIAADWYKDPAFPKICVGEMFGCFHGSNMRGTTHRLHPLLRLHLFDGESKSFLTLVDFVLRVVISPVQVSVPTRGSVSFWILCQSFALVIHQLISKLHSYISPLTGPERAWTPIIVPTVGKISKLCPLFRQKTSRRQGPVKMNLSTLPSLNRYPGKIRVSESEVKTWSDFEPVAQTSGCQWLGLSWYLFSF